MFGHSRAQNICHRAAINVLSRHEVLQELIALRTFLELEGAASTPVSVNQIRGVRRLDATQVCLRHTRSDDEYARAGTHQDLVSRHAVALDSARAVACTHRLAQRWSWLSLQSPLAKALRRV